MIISVMNAFFAQCLGQTIKTKIKGESTNNCIPVKLSLANSFIIEVSDQKEALKLFDEQEITGDPANRIGGNTKKRYVALDLKIKSLNRIVINLKDKAFLQEINHRNENNKARFTIEVGIQIQAH